MYLIFVLLAVLVGAYGLFFYYLSTWHNIHKSTNYHSVKIESALLAPDAGDIKSKIIQLINQWRIK
jgi:H+/Cl- antiporter ClcA